MDCKDSTDWKYVPAETSAIFHLTNTKIEATSNYHLVEFKVNVDRCDNDKELSEDVTTGQDDIGGEVPEISSRREDTLERRTLRCNYCREVLETMEALSQHIEDHEKDKPFNCEKCNIRFKLQQSLVLHNDTEHREHKKPHKCPVCRKRFKRLKKMTAHQKLHLKSKFPCEHCGKTFDFEKLLRRHFIYVHEQGGKKPLVSCHMCGDSFETREELTKHMEKKHIELIIHRCEECGQGFPRKSDLNSHLRLHAYERPFPCDQCHKCFPTKERLASHVETHISEKQFKCTICPSIGFRKKWSLENHIAINHTQVKEKLNASTRVTRAKRYNCDQCDQIFCLASTLDKHYLTHTGDGPYKCKECSVTFPLKYILVEHQKTHSDKKLLRCYHCEKTFFKEFYFKRHLQIHDNHPQISTSTN